MYTFVNYLDISIIILIFLSCNNNYGTLNFNSTLYHPYWLKQSGP